MNLHQCKTTIAINITGFLFCIWCHNVGFFFFWARIYLITFFLGGGGVINVFELPKLLNAFFRSVKYINLVLASIYFRSLVIDLISLYWSLAWGGCQSWTETNGHFMGPCFSTRSIYNSIVYTHRLSWNKATEKGRENCFINAENTTEKHAGPLLINKLLCAFV